MKWSEPMVNGSRFAFVSFGFSFGRRRRSSPIIQSRADAAARNAPGLMMPASQATHSLPCVCVVLFCDFHGCPRAHILNQSINQGESIGAAWVCWGRSTVGGCCWIQRQAPRPYAPVPPPKENPTHCNASTYSHSDFCRPPLHHRLTCPSNPPPQVSFEGPASVLSCRGGC